MFIRCAFFKGKVKEGRQEEFDNYIDSVLIPTWAAFPGAQEVRVLREVESDNAEIPLELVISIRFESREAIEHALASPERFESKEKSQPLIAMFDGEVFHTVFSANQVLSV